jgi:hypothetical protein
VTHRPGSEAVRTRSALSVSGGGWANSLVEAAYQDVAIEIADWHGVDARRVRRVDVEGSGIDGSAPRAVRQRDDAEWSREHDRDVQLRAVRQLDIFDGRTDRRVETAANTALRGSRNAAGRNSVDGGATEIGGLNEAVSSTAARGRNGRRPERRCWGRRTVAGWSDGRSRRSGGGRRGRQSWGSRRGRTETV